MESARSLLQAERSRSSDRLAPAERSVWIAKADCDHCDVVGGGDGAFGEGCRRRDDWGHRPLGQPAGVLDHRDGL